MADEITERCAQEGHPRYNDDSRCYCGAAAYPRNAVAETTTETDALREAANNAIALQSAVALPGEIADHIARAVLRAVLPLHEKQVREQVAAEIKEAESTMTPGEHSCGYLDCYTPAVNALGPCTSPLALAARIARGGSR